jgi:hypothetical protein
MNILVKKLLYSSLFVLLPNVHMVAQVNLVPNASFEDTMALSTLGLYDIAAQHCLKDWHSLDSTRVANCLFYVLNEGMNNTGFRPSGAHYNRLYQMPRHGFGYGGLTHTWQYTWQPPPAAVRSIGSTRLKQQLMQGTKYCAKAYLSPFEREDYFADGFGLYFDNGMLDTIVVKDSSGIYPFVQAQVMCDSIIADTLNWTRVAGTFIAKGDETLGS